MRTKEQIAKLRETHSRPVQVWNLINDDKIKFLLSYYYNSDEVIEKNTGPKTLNVKHGQGVIDDIVESLKPVIGDFKVRSAQIFDVSKPHVLHNDDDVDYPDTYKAITIPLYIQGEGIPKLVFFDQYYYHGPVKLFNGRKEDPKVYYNKPLTNYTNVDNLSENDISQNLKSELLSHLKDEWLKGLSIQSYFPWTIGSGIIFDSLQIHCASNFLDQGVTKKIGLSIFTKK
jgi:hypothetical protein